MSVAVDLFRLDGRVAIVTGASRGIGNAIAVGLAGAGARVNGIGRSLSPQKCEPGFSYTTCDVTQTTSFFNFIANIYEKTGRIDILVNAAGITLPKNFINNSSEVFSQTVACNLTAVFEACRIVEPYMLRGNYGSIINVTSIGAKQGFPGNPGYIASKGGLEAFTRAIALDYGTNGIRVNNLVPGYIRTSMTQASYKDPELRQLRTARTMLGRWGEAEELAAAAIFLASPASSYVTGSDLVVDGGWTARGL